MNFNLNHFRNILGKVNDGTVVFTTNRQGHVTGIEKANYGGGIFTSMRNQRGSTPEENAAIRKLFARTIIASSNAGRPSISAATLRQICQRLGVVQNARPHGDLIGMPLARSEIKAIIDILDNAEEQIKVDNEILDGRQN